MSRKASLVIIAGIVLVVGVAWIFRLQTTKRQHPFDSVPAAAQTQRRRPPFRSAVVELTFRSQSLREGEEILSATGHRIEYIDVAGDRRREDYDNTTTALRQSTSTEALTLIFDGTSLYAIASNEGKQAGRVMNLREGYDYTVWEDAAVEVLKLPDAKISEEQFLGRECKVYRISRGVDVKK